MALIAEELVEEWLNRQGFFTIRGLKVGNSEMDLLAIKLCDGRMSRRHVEVTVSVNPISYICPLTKRLMKKTGRRANSAKKRSFDEMRPCVDGWIENKFRQSKKAALKRQLCDGTWAEELVVHKVRFPEELKLIQEKGVQVHRFNEVVDDLLSGSSGSFTATGTDLVNLLVRPAREGGAGEGSKPKQKD